MPAQLINGKNLAEEILLQLKTQIATLTRAPGLAVILIGNDPASQLYVRNKKRACEKVGIMFHSYFCAGDCLPNVTEKDILQTIDFLNADLQIDGIIVQLPIPEKFNTQRIINQISPAKDVDGFHPENEKNFLAGNSKITPPLIGAINAALQSTGENLNGKSAVIVSGNPVFSQTQKKALADLGLKVKIVAPDDNLETVTRLADVLIVVLGQANFIKKSMVKSESIVIDVGTNLIGKNKWTGDVDPKAAEVADFITPVPGGIGPLTVAMLLKNTFEIAKSNQ